MLGWKNAEAAVAQTVITLSVLPHMADVLVQDRDITPSGSRDSHKQGWSGAFDKLERHFTSDRP